MALLRNACFTINNYTEAEHDLMRAIGELGQHRYLIVGIEKGESGTPHLQGYIALGKRMRLNTVRNLLGGRAHVESARGTPEENRAYCSKEKNFREWGALPKQGERTDIQKIKEDLDKGEPLVSVVKSAMNYQQLKYAETYHKYVSKPNWTREPPRVIWIYGPTGVGKTRMALDICKESPDWEDDTWISGNTLRWWQGYRGQTNVIIDEFRKDFCTFHELLRILDRYPFQVEYKGGSTWLQAKTIIITSCFKPEFVYERREDIGQLLRRITSIVPVCSGSRGGNTGTPRPSDIWKMPYKPEGNVMAV